MLAGITINGKPAADVLGKDLTRTVLDNGVTSFRADDVTFKKTGDYTVNVIANDAEGRTAADAAYKVVQEKAARPAKNVILFVGDGMSLQAREIARILSKGQTNGKYNDLLAMEKLDHNAIMNSASAYSTGHKSVVNAMGVYENSTEDPLDDPRVETMAEILKRTKGMSIGIVTQAETTDATPAAMMGHTRRRALQERRTTSLNITAPTCSWAAAPRGTCRKKCSAPREKTASTSSRPSRIKATPLRPPAKK